MTDLLLVGNDDSGTLAAFRVKQGKLEPLAVTSVGEGCGTFAVDAERDLVYCAVAAPAPAIVTLSLDRNSGELTERHRNDVDDPVHYISLAHDGQVLLAASYGGGWADAWPVSDGVLGQSAGRVEHENCHSVVPSADGRFAHVASLGDDAIAVRGLTPQGLSGDGEDVTCPDGSGPRHLVLSEDQRSLYLLTEFGGEVIRFQRDPESGELQAAELAPGYDVTRGLRHSRKDADPKELHLIWGADLHLAADERFILASERTESTITAISLEDGQLGKVAAVTDTEEQPRGFCVAPDGRHVAVVGELSGHASLYRLEDDGSLTQLDRVETGEGPNWVRFV